jgi:hypothetical protein
MMPWAGNSQQYLQYGDFRSQSILKIAFSTLLIIPNPNDEAPAAPRCTFLIIPNDDAPAASSSDDDAKSKIF